MGTRAPKLMTGFANCLLLLVLIVTAHNDVLANETRAAGFLLCIKGNVLVTRGKVKIEGADRYRFQLGDQIVTDKSSSCEAMHYASAKLYSISGGSSAVIEAGRIALSAASGARKEAIVLKLMSKEVAARAGEPHQPIPEKILGVKARQAPTRLSEPVPFGAVRNEKDSPILLAWQNAIPNQPAGSAITLQLTVTAEGEIAPIINRELPLTASKFVLPQGALQLGKLYRWEVSALGSGIGLNQTGGPIWLLSQEECDQVAAAEKDAVEIRRALPTDAAADMLLAITYENVGLFPQALDCYRAVARIDPDNPVVKASIRKFETLTHRSSSADAR